MYFSFASYLHFTTPHVQVSIPCRNNALSIDIVITSTYTWCIRSRSKYYNGLIEYTYDRENQASGLRLYQKICFICNDYDILINILIVISNLMILWCCLISTIAFEYLWLFIVSYKRNKSHASNGWTRNNVFDLIIQ